MLNVYSITQREEWDIIVKSFHLFDVYYLSGYVKAFELYGDGEPLLLYFSSETLRGINVVMKRDIACDKRFEGKIENGEYFDLTTPYGYGGWYFEGDQTGKDVDTFKEEYTAWCLENKAVSDFVRFHPVLENVSGINNEVYDTTFLGNTVAIYLDSEEKIWERFSSKNRGHIRVAIKEGVTVRTDTSREAFDVFRKIYETTMDHDDALSYYYFDNEFFESIRNDLEGNYTVFTAYLGDTAIASSIMLYAGKFVNYHLSGQLFDYRRYAGTNMILYETAKWGCKSGYDWFHLGGGLGAQEGSLYDFKKSFYKKGDDKLFHVGKRILNPELYEKLVSLRDNLPESNYFPRYRA